MFDGCETKNRTAQLKVLFLGVQFERWSLRSFFGEWKKLPLRCQRVQKRVVQSVVIACCDVKDGLFSCEMWMTFGLRTRFQMRCSLRLFWWLQMLENTVGLVFINLTTIWCYWLYCWAYPTCPPLVHSLVPHLAVPVYHLVQSQIYTAKPHIQLQHKPR